ncbi:PAS domain S-box protein [Desulfocurvibacter africanus]|uniref:PAS domain S-box protein n=1 Tax=Desulfocurvibacter africanus TaxID=873 RepID=UPI002FDABA77
MLNVFIKAQRYNPISLFNSSLRHSLFTKVFLTGGLTLLASITALSYHNITLQKERVFQGVVSGADRLANTIRLGTHYAMMLNSRDDIREIIHSVSRQKDIRSIRIYNKQGEITFSNASRELGTVTNIRDKACHVCHHSEPPLTELDSAMRVRTYEDAQGRRFVGVLSPIYNEPNCASSACHYHPADKKVLGALDVVFSLEESDRALYLFQVRSLATGGFIFLLTSWLTFLCVNGFVRRPIKRLMFGAATIAKGEPFDPSGFDKRDEIGELATTIERMSRDIEEKQLDLNRQRDEYQKLFELVPCAIVVVDREYKILRYNRLFDRMFDARAGSRCHEVFKGREERCPNCPVAETFSRGTICHSEESRENPDGSSDHWFVTTSPIYDADGEIVAAMEVCLDITQRKELEQRLMSSEKKYHAIFNNIPNPVFVLDPDSLTVLDANDSVAATYGFSRSEITGMSFMDFFLAEDRQEHAARIRCVEIINQAQHRKKDGGFMYVRIRVSPSCYPGRNVLLVTTSDITKRLETEQQLLQASKMSTLGEMATGVAHELNQPLTVINTAASFIMRKVGKGEELKPEILATLSEEMVSHIQRATKIINHLREFGRKPQLRLERVRADKVLARAFELFGQQLALRGIEVVWDMEPDLPEVLAMAGSLEQVFINLLINARDALEEHWKSGRGAGRKRITLQARADLESVVLRIRDNGPGVPKGLCEKIFEPFFTTKAVGKGTGLGLSISYGIIKDFSGTIWVEETPDGGACFVITLPQIQDSQP